MNRKRELLENTIVFAIGSFGSKLILFFLVPLYTAYMTPEEYGVAELITTTSELVIPLATLSFSEAVFRFTLTSQKDKQDTIKCFYIVFFVSSCIVAAVALCLVLVPMVSGYSLIFAIMTVLSILRDTYALYLKALDRTKLFALDGILYVIYLAGSNIVLLVVLDLGINGYLISLIIAKGLSLGFLLVAGRQLRLPSIRGLKFDLLKSMLKYSAPLMLNSISWWVVTYVNRFFLSVLMGATSVGLFAVAVKIPSFVTTVVNVFMQAWAITSIKEYESERNPELYRSVFQSFNLVIEILACIVIMVVYPLMSVYVGEAFRDAVSAVPFLLLGAVFLAQASFFGIIFNSAKASMDIMTSSVGAAVVAVALNAVLIPCLGVVGASISTAGSYLAMFLIRFIRSRKYIRFNVSPVRLTVSLLVLVVQASAVTVGFYPYAVSAGALALLLAVNGSSIKAGCLVISSFVARGRSK